MLFNQLYAHQTCWQPPLLVLKKYRIQDSWINECNRKTVIIIALIVHLILDVCNALVFLYYAILCTIFYKNVLLSLHMCSCCVILIKSHSIRVTVVEWACHALYQSAKRLIAECSIMLCNIFWKKINNRPICSAINSFLNWSVFYVILRILSKPVNLSE